MTVRTPLYWDATLNSNQGGLREMSSAMVTEIVNEAARQYALNPSVTLSMSSGTDLDTMTDNYRVAGTDSTNVSTYVTPGATGTGTVDFVLKQTVDSVAVSTIGADKEAPLYWTGTRLQEFSDQDFYDTFIDPALEVVIGASGGGSHYISTSGSTVIFQDRVFNSGTYASSTYVDDDTTQTITYTTVNEVYYLNTYAAASAGSFTVPVGWDGTNDRIAPLADADFQTLLQEYVRYHASRNAAGIGIRYQWETSAPAGTTVNARGSAVDTQRDGTTQFNKFIDANDYRSRNFPTGSLTTTETRTLYIIRI